MGASSTSKSTSSHHHHRNNSTMGMMIMGFGTLSSNSSSPSSSWLPVIIFLLVALCGEGNSGSQITFIVGTGDMSPPASASALTAASSSSSPGALGKQSTVVGDGSSGSGSGHNSNNHANGHQAMMMVMPQGNGKPAIESLGNVTVLAGQRGELKCRVSNLANNTVLWLRHRDTHLLSAGADAYTQDPRFRAFQGPGNTWGLRVSSTRPTDGGVYECQISTTPPVSAFTYLTVVEPVTRIEGLNGRGFELFIKAGSTINLTCVVEDATDNAPKHILWKHDSRVVNFEWARGGMSLVTEKKSKGVTVSRLLIRKAVRTDSGTYLCAPQNAHPAHVKIVVLEQGEKQAAMQSGSLSTKCVNTSFLPALLLSVICQLLLFSSSLLTTTLGHMISDKSKGSNKKNNKGQVISNVINSSASSSSSPSSSLLSKSTSTCTSSASFVCSSCDTTIKKNKRSSLAQREQIMKIEADDKINNLLSMKENEREKEDSRSQQNRDKILVNQFPLFSS